MPSELAGFNPLGVTIFAILVALVIVAIFAIVHRVRKAHAEQLRRSVAAALAGATDAGGEESTSAR